MAHVIGIIPARGGSKGIPDKNISMLGEKPLIAWTIEAAKRSNVLDGIIVSTDSEKIANAARGAGIDVHSLRPAALSDDNAKTIDVISHEIDVYEKRTSKYITNIVLLQPTSPLRVFSDIDESYQAYKKAGFESLITVSPVEQHPSIMYRVDGSRLEPYVQEHQAIRRQDMPPLVARNGAVYICSRAQIETGKIIADPTAYYEMPAERSVNIDEPADLEYAQWLITRMKSRCT